MKQLFTFLALVLSLTIYAQTPIAELSESLAQEQLDAYNARDIEKFIEPYSDSVEIYQFPNKLLYKGKDKMRISYGGMFEKVTELHCELVHRTVQGNVVIDQERVTGFPSIDTLRAVAIYTIENGKIQKVHFIQ